MKSSGAINLMRLEASASPPQESVAQQVATAFSRAGDLPPAIILGGEANALSVVRSLGRMGVKVFALGEPGSAVGSSRYCNWVQPNLDGGTESAWARWLLGPQSEHLEGAVLLAASDAGIRVIMKNRDALLGRYRLDESNPAAQLQMLDKMTTYRNAIAAGVDTPKFWTIESAEEAIALKDELIFPLIVKPHMSHVFEEKFGKKYIFANNLDQVLSAIEATSAAGVKVLLMEYVPGPDSQLCSYFTYLTEDGSALFHFTKRVIRRFPVGMGAACYHITDWIPEIVEPSLKLFRHVGLRGLANVEYKQDPRTGAYKLIECNARFVGSNGLVARSGFDLARFVYDRITGRPQAKLEKYKSGLRLWDPGRDWSAFRELHGQGQITFPQWLKSIAHPQTFSWFALADPMPAIARALKPVRKAFGSKKN